MIDTTNLRKLAQKATPGPWLLRATEWNLYLVQSGREGDGSIVDTAYSRRNDIDYIAAANPATVLQLIDEIDRLHTIEAAARNLAKVKGRHHAEIAMNRLQATLAASE